MSALGGEALALGTACAAWPVAAYAARHRGIALGAPPYAVLVAVAAASALAQTGWAETYVLAGGIAIAAICDARTGFLFAPLTSFLAALTLASTVLDGRTANAAFGAAAVCGALALLYTLTGGRGIGFGDVRLGFALGAGLGAPLGLLAIAWAFALGGVYAASLLALRPTRPGAAIRFAPFLAAGTLAALVPLPLP